MPMIQELLTKLQESPPQTEEELTSLLDETGYELTMKEPGGEEVVPPEEEMPPEEEEMPPEGEEEVAIKEETSEGPEGMLGALKDLLPAPGPDMSPKGMSILRMKVSKKALDKGSKGKKGAEA